MVKLLLLDVQVVTIEAKPQYRVVVHPSLNLLRVTVDATDVRATMCFRELDNTDMDQNYCPLGVMTFSPGEPSSSVQLQLGEGSNVLDAAYPRITTTHGFDQGVGMLIYFTGMLNGNQTQLAQVGVPEIGLAPGILHSFEINSAPNNIIYNVYVSVVCVPEYTGVTCVEPVPTQTPMTEVSTTNVVVPVPVTTINVMETFSSFPIIVDSTLPSASQTISSSFTTSALSDTSTTEGNMHRV